MWRWPKCLKLQGTNGLGGLPVSQDETSVSKRQTAGPSGGRRCVFLQSDVVALQLSIEGSAADAKHLARQSFVAAHLVEYALDGGALQLLQVAIGNGSSDRQS